MSKAGVQLTSSNNDPAEDDLQNQLTAFLHDVGARVLETRRQLKMSRRVLSERSGVSQRTIVLLETGAGNISISLLYRVAHALDRQPGWFLQPDTLEDEPGLYKRKRICLIGLRGAGKSTLGALLSESLATDFVESNAEIETISGLSVQELINLYGQEGYRQLEKQALEKTVSEYESVVLAAAGGVVSDPDTYAYLLKHFYTIWLRAEPEEHMQRVRQQGDERPMAGNPQAMKELKTILTSRESMYGSADLELDTSGKTVKACSKELLSMVKNSVRDAA